MQVNPNRDLVPSRISYSSSEMRLCSFIKSKFSLALLFLMSIFHLTKQGNYQISGPFSSKKPLFRFATQGPIPNVFSICPDTTMCLILDYLDNNKELYRTPSAASPYAFSSQYLKKTLLTGYPTRLLDFSQGKNPVVRGTINPDIIIHCVYSMQSKWICVSGKGVYFRWDMKQEKTIMTYQPVMSGLLAQVNNKRCTHLGNQTTLFCASLDKSIMQVFNVTNPQANFQQYDGPFKPPFQPEGADSYLEALVIYSISPVQVKAGNYTDGKIYYSWNKPYNATVFTMADVKTGILLVVRQGATEITNLKDGSILKFLPVKITSAEFGELDNFMYYGDDTNNEYRYLGIYPPLDESKKFVNCSNYIYGIGRCGQCQAGYKIHSFGSCIPINPDNNPNNQNQTQNNFNGNNIPGLDLVKLDKNGEFLNPQAYGASVATIDDRRTMIDFNQLASRPVNQRQKYLQNLALKDGNKNYLHYILINDDNQQWRQDQNLKFYPQNYTSLWNRGKLLLRHQTNRSYDSFNGRLAIVAPPVVKRVLELIDDLTVSEEDMKEQVERIMQSMSISDSPNLQGSKVNPSSQGSLPKGSPKKSPYTLKNVKPLIVPAHWEPWSISYPISDAFFGLVKILIILLQLFMVCIRPLNLKYRKSKWAMWFGSTLTSYQIALIMGMVPGNFGGFVEQIHSAAFNAFRQYFWLDPLRLKSDSYLKESRAIPLGKFEVNNYFASPPFENLIDLIVFILGSLIGLGGCGNKDKDNTSSHIRIGTSISFMIPLTLCSVACIAKCFYLSNWDSFTYISVILSIGILFYFISGLANNVSGCSDSRLSEEDYYFRAYDIDELNKQEGRSFNFIQRILNFLIPLALIALSNCQFIGAISMMILHALMFIFFQKSKSKRQSALKNQDRLQKICNLKTIDALLKLIMSILHVLFWATLRLRNLFWTQVLSVLLMTVLVINILVITGTLITRIMHLQEEEYQPTDRKNSVKEVIEEAVHTESDQSWNVNGSIPNERKDEEMKSTQKKKFDSYPDHPHATYDSNIRKGSIKEMSPKYSPKIVKISPNANMGKSPYKDVPTKTREFNHNTGGLMSTERNLFDRNHSPQKTVERGSQNSVEFERYDHHLPFRNRTHSPVRRDNYEDGKIIETVRVSSPRIREEMQEEQLWGVNNMFNSRR